MPFTDTPHGALFYAISRTRSPEGEPTLVLVHGAGGTHLLWPAELRRLPGATVYALDLPGHGRSEGRSYDTIEAYAAAVRAFLAANRIEAAVIAGHSMGGAIATTLALECAECVAGLVLLATCARLRVAPGILTGIRQDFTAAVEHITQRAWSPAASPELIRLGREALLETDPQVMWDDFTACSRFDVTTRLADIKAPALVIAGTADQLTPVRCARSLSEGIPRGRSVIVEQAGHMVMLEQPATTGRAMRMFLDAHRQMLRQGPGQDRKRP